MWAVAGLLAAGCILVGLICSASWVFNQWAKPTLAEKLQTYERLAGRLAPIHNQWLRIITRFHEIYPYYRLMWSENAAEVLSAVVADQSRLNDNLVPVTWTIHTGGQCDLQYHLTFTSNAGSKRQHFDRAVDELRGLASSVAAESRIDYPSEDLWKMTEAQFKVSFNLRVRAARFDEIPAIPDALQHVMTNLNLRCSTNMSYTMEQGGFEGKSIREMLDTVRMKIAPSVENEQAFMHKAHEFDQGQTVNPGSLLRQWEEEIREDSPALQPLDQALSQWENLAERRFPWRRISELDNAAVSREISNLQGLLRSDLPAIKELEMIHQRIDKLRECLLGGYSDLSVFDEGAACCWIRETCRDQCGVEPDANIRRAAEYDKLVLCEWEVSLASGSGQRRRADVSVNDLAAFVQNLAEAKAGFQVARIQVDFISKPGIHANVDRARISGLLPVRKTMD